MNRWLRRLVGGPRYHRLLDELTAALQAGEHARAATRAQDCIEAATSMFGDRDAEVVGPLYARASACLALQRFDDAAAASDRAIAIASKTSSEPPLHQLWEQRAAIADRAGQDDAFLSALEEVVAAAANDPLARATAHNRLGLAHGRAERFEEAAKHFAEALDLRRRKKSDSLEVAEVLHNAATFRAPEDEPPIDAFEEALAIAQKNLSKEASQLEGRIAHNFAVLRQELFQGAEAEALYHQALAAFERDHPATSPALRPTLARLGRLLQAARRFEEAVPLLQRAHTIAESELGADHDITGKIALWLGDANSGTYR